MFNELVQPGDSVSFIEQMSGAVLGRMTLSGIEFTEQGQLIRVEIAAGIDLRSKHEFRVSPHRLISFPDRTRGTDMGRVEFYDPQIDLGGCSVPIVIHAADNVSIHVDHKDAMAADKP
jgi:hypothetical protein